MFLEENEWVQPTIRIIIIFISSGYKDIYTYVLAQPLSELINIFIPLIAQLSF